MKKVLISLITFTFGCAGFYLFAPKQTVEIREVFPAHTIQETSDVQTEVSIDNKIKESDAKDIKPFFDSFEKDEDYGGWLIADDFEGMDEVWTVLLNRDNYERKDGKYVWSAMILTKNPDYTPNDDDEFRSISIKTEKNKLTFRTSKIRGIEYRFDGEFFETRHNFDDERNVLKGTLQKFVKGKKVAEVKDDFAYYEPKCFH